VDEITNDAGSADSSSAEVESTTQPAATEQAQQTTPTPEPPFHQHPRFREITSQNRELRQQVQQLTQWAQQQMQRQQQSASQPGLSKEETEALTVLKKLMKADPELAAALGVAGQLGQFQQRFHGMDQMQARAAQAHNNAARSAIKEMASAEGLDTSDANMKHIVRVVAGAAMDLENGNERYANGDLSVLQEAFDQVKKGWLSTLRKPAEQSLTQTKNKLRQMPPPSRGATAGSPAPAKLERGNERAFESSLHERAKKMLGDLSQG
jgi:hypothetical protein